MVFRRQNVLFLSTNPLCPHEGKLQTDRLEFKDFEIEVLTRSSFFWLGNIVRMFDQNAMAASESP